MLSMSPKEVANQKKYVHAFLRDVFRSRSVVSLPVCVSDAIVDVDDYSRLFEGGIIALLVNWCCWF